jgi:hypothetical protein
MANDFRRHEASVADVNIEAIPSLLDILKAVEEIIEMVVSCCQ